MLKLCSLFLLGFFLTGTNAGSSGCICSVSKDIHAESHKHTDKITGTGDILITGVLGFASSFVKITEANITTAVLTHIEGTTNTYLLAIEGDLTVIGAIVGTVMVHAKASIVVHGEIKDGCKHYTPDMDTLKLELKVLNSLIAVVQLLLNALLNALLAVLRAALKLLIGAVLAVINDKNMKFKEPYNAGGQQTHCEVTESTTDGNNINTEYNYFQNGNKHIPPKFPVTRLDDESHCTGVHGATIDFLIGHIQAEHVVVISAAVAQTWGLWPGITEDVTLKIYLTKALSCNTPKGSHSVNVWLAASLWVGTTNLVTFGGNVTAAVNTVHKKGCMGYSIIAGAAIGLSVTSTHEKCSCDGAHDKLKDHLDVGASAFFVVLSGKMGCIAKTGSPDASNGKEKPCEQEESGCRCGYANN